MNYNGVNLSQVTDAHTHTRTLQRCFSLKEKKSYLRRIMDTVVLSEDPRRFRALPV